MTDSDALELRWPRIAARLLLTGTLSAALYLFSIGPVYWLVLGHSAFGNERALSFYAPVYRMAEVQPVAEVLGTYCTWWAELPGGSIERMLQDGQN
jgi:hypothetical protein